MFRGAPGAATNKQGHHRDGNLLLLVKDHSTAQKFIEAKELYGLCSIQCCYHNSLNYSKGTVYAPYLNCVPEEEIVRELKDVGVVEAYKFTTKKEGKVGPSGVVLLTFDLYQLPEKIKITWNQVTVREYFPNPMRCKTCQLLGHTSKRCTNSPVCVGCNLPPHSPTECSRTMCANCLEAHASSSNACPKFIQQKEILKIQTKKSVRAEKQSAPTMQNIMPPNDQIPILIQTMVTQFMLKLHHSPPIKIQVL